MKKILQNKYLPFWLLTFSIVSALVLPVLVMDGMFMDGVLYACVSKNLANGYGSMWWLRYSEYGFAEHVTFHEHPPLIFWIQSLFFKILGNGMYTERIYSFFTCVVTILLITKTWKLINRDNEALSKMSWLAVIFWIIIPVCFWAYQNNIQENTMGIFSLLSVIFVIRAVHAEERIWLNLFLAGTMIFCAGFSKGIPGLFTLGAVFFHWLIFRRQSFGRMLLQNAFVLTVCFGILGLVLLIPDARQSLSIYFNDRLMGRVSAAHNRDSHFYIVERLFWELLPLIIISGITLLIYQLRKTGSKLQRGHLKWAGFFVIIGLCGSVPIMFTLVQKTFYFVGSLPYFGLGFALMIAPGMSERLAQIDITKKSRKMFLGSTAIFLLMVFVITGLQIGKVSRNKDVLYDLSMVDDYIPENCVINVHPSMHNEWDMRVYLIRYHMISVDFDERRKRQFYLMRKDLGIRPDTTYKLVDLNTRKYDLYQHQED